MTIPSEKQKEFIKYSQKVLAPTWVKFGCLKYELHKVEENKTVERQLIEKNRFIERLYFADDFDVSGFFESVRKNEEAFRISKSYEDKFGAKKIVLRILGSH